VFASEVEGTRLPEAGDLSIVTLGDGTPVAIIETTDVRHYRSSSASASGSSLWDTD
jgi:uncharacterized protein YhfF